MTQGIKNNNDVEIESLSGNVNFNDANLASAIPISQLATTGLTGFTAISIIAGLNEVKAGQSGYTAGSALFAGATGIIAQDNTNFFWDNTNKRLGIGTNTPAQAFDLIGNLLTQGQNILGGATYPRADNLYAFGSPSFRWSSAYIYGRTIIGNEAAIPTALLQIASTTQGFLQPRMTTVQRDAIISPATGLEIYNTTDNRPEFYNGSTWNEVGIPATSYPFFPFSTTGAFGAQTVYPNYGYIPATEAFSQLMSIKGKITKLDFYVSSNTLNTSSTLEIRKNGVGTGIIVTVNATTTGRFTATGNIAVVAGDLLSVQAILGGTGAQIIGFKGGTVEVSA